MSEQSYKAPEVTKEMKIKYYADAERGYRSMPKEKLQKEYNQLVRGKTPWEWLKERMGSFVNMVKIAALSVFLGRQETVRRIQTGNRDAEFEKLKEEAKKDAKIYVLEEKLETLPKRQEDKSKETSDEKKEEQGKGETIKEGHEQANSEEQLKNREYLTKEPAAEEEKRPSQSEQERTQGISIFAEQVECATDKYKEGLQKYLEAQTGINGAFINIDNATDKDKSFLRISFDSIPLSENSELEKGVTIDKKGNCLEQTKIASNITKAVLYYTAEVHRESKNNTRVIGTVPSGEMCTEILQSFRDKALENLKNGDINCKYQESLFGHKIDFEKNGDSIHISLNGNELDFPDGFSTKSLTDQIRDTMLDKKFGDFTSNAEFFISDNLHEITRNEIEPAYFVKYSGQELEEKFGKILNDMLLDGGELIRELNFHTYGIEVAMNDHEIHSIAIDGEDVYRDIDGKQDIEQIAGHIADTLGEKLAIDEMYRFDESLEKLEDVIDFSNSDMQTHEEVSDFEQTMEYDDHDDERDQ